MVSKTARLEARLTARNQSVIQRAATIRGQSVTDFVVAASLAEAERIISESRILELSQADQERFVTALLKPNAPTKRMKQAISAHRQMIDPS